MRYPGKRFGLLVAGGAAIILLVSVVAFVLLDLCCPFPYERLHPPSASRVLDRHGHELRRFLASDSKWRFPVTLDEVAPELVTALIESEDRWFYSHPGVNPVAVLRAMVVNLRSGRVVSGASTIPMQIARMAEPKDRTIANKVVEMFRAVQLSLRYSKRELLEIYLNMAPFGGNIEGVGAASLLYFNKTPARLSLGESAFLAVLPRAPNRYNPVRHPKAAMQVRGRVLKLLKQRAVISDERFQGAMRQPMVAVRRASPMLAPHFALMAKARLHAQPQMQTTLDMDMQRTLEKLVARHGQRVRPFGISNVAAVVIDRRTREVLALAGSVDFHDDLHQGQVNNALSRRSPGSTLKPFLYALAFDRGSAIPSSALLDVPTEIAGYTPENYSGTFSGQVTVAQALSRSLNVPAVRLLERTGLQRFHALLRRGGLESIDKPYAHYGLQLVLGGCEVRLVDLVNLYATLAEGGKHYPWRIAPRGPEALVQLVSPEAARVVSDMLTEVTRPDMPDAWRLTRDRPVAAWKTGTSFGHKDAWAVGFGTNLAVGVWVGNPDGSAAMGISGAVHAGPLFFAVLRALDAHSRDLRLSPAPALQAVSLCAASRELAGPDCPEVVEAVAGPTLHLPRCRRHQRRMVDAQTGLQLMGDCLLTHSARSEVFETLAPELAAWQRAQGKPVPGLPEMSPECLDVPGQDAPVIESPSAKTLYVLRRDLPQQYQQVQLLAVTPNPEQELWWYVDGRFVGTSSGSRRLFYAMQAGDHVAGVTDASGRTTTVTFTVTAH